MPLYELIFFIIALVDTKSDRLENLQQMDLVSVSFSLDGQCLVLRFENLTMSNIQPADLEERSCSDLFTTPGLANSQTMMQKTCTWKQENVLFVCFSQVSPLLNVENIVLQRRVIHINGTQTFFWTSPAHANYRVGVPDPPSHPVVELLASAWAFSGIYSYNLVDSGDFEVPLCSPAYADARTSYNHGGFPRYTWQLVGVKCRYSDSYGYVGIFLVNQTTLQRPYASLNDASATAQAEIAGAGRIYFSASDLEPGCSYEVSLRVGGRWGSSSEFTFTLSKQSNSGRVGQKPPCSYQCNAATCEPPSQCRQNTCVCAEGRYGPHCQGICPKCSPFRSEGCDDGSSGSGKCLCHQGWHGDYCDQKLEWRETGWSSCQPCGAARGSQYQLIQCVNVVTLALMDDARCGPGMEFFDSVNNSCVPHACPCGRPPDIEHGNLSAMASMCHSLLSGGSCPASCLPGFVGIGEYRCYQATFIEVPYCIAAGALISFLTGISVLFRVYGFTSSVNADQFLQDITPAFQASIVHILSSQGLVSCGHVFRVSKQSGVSLPDESKRTNEFIISATMAVTNGNGSDLLALQLFESLQSDPAPLLSEFIVEYARSCFLFCHTNPSWEMLSPRRTQVSVTGQSCAASSTTTTTTATNLVPQSSDNFWTKGLLGLLGGGCCMLGSVVACACFWRKRSRKRYDVAPVPIAAESIAAENGAIHHLQPAESLPKSSPGPALELLPPNGMPGQSECSLEASPASPSPNPIPPAPLPESPPPPSEPYPYLSKIPLDKLPYYDPRTPPQTPPLTPASRYVPPLRSHRDVALQSTIGSNTERQHRQLRHVQFNVGRMESPHEQLHHGRLQQAQSDNVGQHHGTVGSNTEVRRGLLKGRSYCGQFHDGQQHGVGRCACFGTRACPLSSEGGRSSSNSKLRRIARGDVPFAPVKDIFGAPFKVAT